MTEPRITVVIPSFNHGKFLREAVESVELAAGKSVEIIIVDDGSTDGTSTQVAADLKAEGYQVILQNNQG
ncbi:MAG TPA: glycosyltransferase, partial [Catalimonadaceae bacterium]|nr:glycosyltransferase [Catalimonadaceae bacterium]